MQVSDWGRQSHDVSYLAVEMYGPVEALLQEAAKKANRKSTAKPGKVVADVAAAAGTEAGGDAGVVVASVSLPLTHAVDCWAFGIVAIEVFADGRRAYDAAWDDRKIQTEVKAGFRPEQDENTSKEHHELMQKCLDAVPGRRPDFFWLRAELEATALAEKAKLDAKRSTMLEGP